MMWPAQLPLGVSAHSAAQSRLRTCEFVSCGAADWMRPGVEPQRGLLFFWQLGGRDQLALDGFERVAALKLRGDCLSQLLYAPCFARRVRAHVSSRGVSAIDVWSARGRDRVFRALSASMWSDRWSLRVTGSLSDGRRQEFEGASLLGFRGRPARERRPLAATSLHHKHRWDLRDDLQAAIHAANPLLIPRIRASPSFNPVRCMTNGCVVLDMRLRIERRRPVERVKTW